MSALSHDSELEFLNLTLPVCAILAAASVALWMAVFVLRMRRRAVTARIAAAKETLTGGLLAEIIDPAAPAVSYAHLSRLKRRVLVQVLQELAGQIKGHEKDRLIGLLQREGFFDAALRALRDRRPAERQSACALLRHCPQPSSSAALRTALADRDLGVRLMAARSLLARDEVPSLRGLLESLRLSPVDPPLVLTDLLARAPASLRPEAILLLGEPLPDEWKRILAIALGRSQAPEAFLPLAALVRHPADRVRAAAWIALRELGDPQAADLLRHGLADPNASVRQAACQCAAILGRPEHFPPLAAIVRRDEWEVSHAAARALWALGPEARAILRAHGAQAGELDAGVQVLREHEMEEAHEA